MKTTSNIAFCLLFVGAALTMPAAKAADDPAKAAVRQIAQQWETIKFSVPEGETQTAQMNALGEKADALAAQYPSSVNALIWDGILTSERASMASAFSALGLAKRARAILEQADKMDPAAAEAGAPTTLGVLYYRVPGFPIGFGDKARARKLLEQAVQLAPQGLDAWYFYGDFLYTQGDYAKASEVLNHALTFPQHPDRPLWDKNRRLVIQELLQKIKART